MSVTMNGADILDRGELHAFLAGALALPDWYGRNLDALWDCLTSLHEPLELRIQNYAALEEHLGAYTDLFIQVVRDAADENGRITLTIE